MTANHHVPPDKDTNSIEPHSRKAEKILSRNGYTKILDTDFVNCQLSGDELILLRKLISLCKNDQKSCIATNEYLAQWRNVPKRNVERWIRKLEDAGYIHRTGEGSKRIISIVQDGTDHAKNGEVYHDKFDADHAINGGAPRQKWRSTTPKVAYIEDNKKIIKRKREGDSLSSDQNKNADRSAELLQWFNECLTRFQLNGFELTEKRMQAAAALLNAHAFTDVTRIIKFKCLQWHNEEKMRPHLRPDTLFKPDLFTKYLEEIKNQPAREWTEKSEADDALPDRVDDNYPF